jgi:hypothetical protein
VTLIDRIAAMRELRALVGTYLEGSDDAARATALLDALEPTQAAPTTAYNGVWTPWSLVLCVECDYAGLQGTPRAQHNAKHFEIVSKMDRAAKIVRSEGNLLGTCNNCQCKCWVRADVALLQAVGFNTSGLVDREGPFNWALQQTGGMCAALVFQADSREIVVTAMDSHFFVGEYKRIPDDSPEEPWIDAIRTWQSETLYADDELRPSAELAAIAEQCARKVIDFVRDPAVESAS